MCFCTMSDFTSNPVMTLNLFQRCRFSKQHRLAFTYGFQEILDDAKKSSATFWGRGFFRTTY